MDFVSPVTGIISLLWGCSARQTNYLHKLEENLSSLRASIDELKNARDDVKTMVEAKEELVMTRTHLVDGWLKRVEAMEHEVVEILQQGSTQIEGRCFRGCYPKNCWTSYKFGRKVILKLKTVAELRSKGDFEVVAVRSQAAPVQAMPDNPTVGMDVLFEKVWRLLGEDEVRIVGLYGMGGVGKTTLLKKINNQFLKESCDFDLVIWVGVSRELNLERVQNDIGERLGLSWPNGEDQRKRAEKIFESLKKKKFLFLLDDIWERVDIEIIGIPPLHTQNKSKIVFTTRSEAVCGHMEIDKKIKVESLDWDDAWDLFQKKVGQESLNSHPEIPMLAETVTKECGGLPLALLTIGRAMASKKTPHEWNHAITVLKKSASDISGMGDEVFPLLKFSYDSLDNDTIRSCFLYCSLYPEDFSIKKEELIQHWIGEGFLDGFDDMDEARNHGHDIIGSLKVTCLLESGDDEEMEVKMCDVIRDMALWIASECGRKKDNFLVQAHVGLLDTPKVEKWKEAERVSLMHNEIQVLTKTPTCPNLSTLLLQYNYLYEVSNDFFQFMPALRVLNLSRTRITEFPIGITELVELQYLDLSNTGIQKLPDELEKLDKLKYLNLSQTVLLSTIPRQVIASLSRLQVLNVYNSFGDWQDESCASTSDQFIPSLGDLKCLEHINGLGITIKTDTAVQRLFSYHKLQMCTMYLCVRECQGVTSLALSPSSPSSSASASSSSSSSSISLGNMKSLRELMCDGCSELEQLIISCPVEGEIGLLSSLETLVLYNLPKLNIVWEKAVSHLSFQNLQHVDISGCHALNDLTWLLRVRSLRMLRLVNCTGIEEVILDGVTAVDEKLNTFSRLKTMEIVMLPNLKSICRHALPFPSLMLIRVYDCPQLKKLPLDSNSAKTTLRRIEGESKWWHELSWEDETSKSSFVPYFIGR